jgi:hypothetical protein
MATPETLLNGCYYESPEQGFSSGAIRTGVLEILRSILPHESLLPKTA